MVEGTFLKLKQALTLVPVLTLLNFSNPFKVEADASRVGMRAALM